MQIYLLIVLMLMILYLAYCLMNRDLVSPAVVFIAPFCAALICAAIYRTKWELNIHFNTFMVILLGCFEFAIVCIIIHLTLGKKCRRKLQCMSSKYKENMQVIHAEPWKILGIILIQLLSVYVVYFDMKRSLGRYGISGNLRTLMYYFREYRMFSDYQVGLSSIGSNLRLVSIAVTYIWIYIICNNRICKARSKHLLLMLISVSLGIVNSAMLGARGEAIQIIMAVILIFLFLQKKYNGWKAILNFKQVLLIALLFMILMFGFKTAGDLVGRSTVINYHLSAVDELAKYLGAEIKNLDIYLENPFENNQIIGSQTFGTILGWIGGKLHLNWEIKALLPFQKVNGISLGNVYTVFYAYISDFGYWGVFFLTMIYAAIVQIVYEYAQIERKNTRISFNIILNSYILFSVAFSFFGERFFSAVLNISFIKYILIWKFMIWFITKLKIKGFY